VRARAGLVTILLIGVGCTTQPPAAVSSPKSPTNVTSPSATPIPTEADNASVRTACATRVLEGLIRAFNTGDALALEKTIGSGPLGAQGFQWVSFADGMGRDSETTTDGARRMLLDRWSRGQRLTLVSVNAGAGPSWHGGVDAGVKLESRAPGLTGAASISGKTALSCVGARVYVLSLGSD
jgi:hypothetical protein